MTFSGSLPKTKKGVLTQYHGLHGGAERPRSSGRKGAGTYCQSNKSPAASPAAGDKVKVILMAETVLVLGGGTGGIVAANVLGKALARKHRVVLVERNDSHYFQAAYPLLIINQRQPEQISKKLDTLKKKGVELFQAEVKYLDISRRLVETSRGALDYDFLVIAMGAEHHPESVPGMKEGSFNPYSFEGAGRLRQKLAAFRQGRVTVFIAGLPYTGIIAPWEIVFLLEDYFRKRGLRRKIELTMVTPEAAPLPLAGARVGESVRRMVEQRGVRLLAGTRVLSLDLDRQTLLLDHGLKVPGELFIGIPPHRGPSALHGSGLELEGGWIEVNPHTLETRADRVFAVGDAAAITLPLLREWAPKAGFFAHYQAEVAARNIALMIAGKAPRFRYTGKAAGAVMLTGMGMGRLASLNFYASPGPKVTLLHPTRPACWAKVAFEKYWLYRWF